MDKKVIQSMPIWAQDILQSCISLRAKREEKRLLDRILFYESHNNWSYEQKCDYRDAELRKLVDHCYRTVPYYKRIFDEGGINPMCIRTLDDLKVLPLLTKDMVIENPSDFQSSAVKSKDIKKIHTSGTTGSGFAFNSTIEGWRSQLAIWWRYYRNLGLDLSYASGVFNRSTDILPSQKKPPFYRLDRVNNRVNLSSFHMKEDNMDSYIEGLNKVHAKWIKGWPSMIDEFANILISKGMTFPLNFVTTGAENLLDTQIAHIEKAFGVTPYQHYGQMEAVANFSQNKHHEMYVDEDFSAVEFIPLQDGRGECEIVGTCLTNYATPLLRYRTKDICHYKETTTGRLITRLDGRQEDYILLPDGTKIGRLDDLFVSFEKVKESQVIQTSRNDLKIRIVRREGYSEGDEKQIEKRINEFLPGLSITFDYVDTIEKSRSGKLRHIISEIKNV